LFGTIKNILDEDYWWYTACVCNKAVYPDSKMFFCEKCNKHVMKVILRYTYCAFHLMSIQICHCTLQFLWFINFILFTDIGSKFEWWTHQIQPHLCYLIGMQPSF